MDILLILPILIPLLGSFFVAITPKNTVNAFNVCVFTLVSCILAVLLLCSLSHINSSILVYKYLQHWPTINSHGLFFSASLNSLLLLLACCFASIIGMCGLNDIQKLDKNLFILILIFIFNINGLFISGDIITFCIFFTGLLIPLYLLIGLYGNVKKFSTQYLFLITNYTCALFLLIAVCIAYKYGKGNLMLTELTALTIPTKWKIVMWFFGCTALLLRMPIWPFYHWAANINMGIKNPVVFILNSWMPLTAVFGFFRFFYMQNNDYDLAAWFPLIETFGILMILYIAFIGIAQKDFMPKFFSYTCIYYLVFLLAIILLDEQYKINITYAIFTFIIINASLTVFDAKAENACIHNHFDYRGILAYMPHLTHLFALFLLIAIGLPISALFWNNFVLITAFFRESFYAGCGIMIAIILVNMALLYELFIMRSANITHIKEQNMEITDISDFEILFFLGIFIMLFLAFFNPIWFLW